MLRCWQILTLLILGWATSYAEPLAAQDGPAEQMRTAAVTQGATSTLPAALTPRASEAWQATSPPALKRSLRKPTPSEREFVPRIAGTERGVVDRYYPATEQLALGLSADPPRPLFPTLLAGPRSTADGLEPNDVVNLPPLSRTSEAKIALVGDPASTAAKPYVAPLVKASRPAAPPRNDVGVPDPFVVQREVKLARELPDVDPPAPHFLLPPRPKLPMAEPKAEE